jgi:hypothetical protein
MFGGFFKQSAGRAEVNSLGLGTPSVSLIYELSYGPSFAWIIPPVRKVKMDHLYMVFTL